MKFYRTLPACLLLLLICFQPLSLSATVSSRQAPLSFVEAWQMVTAENDKLKAARESVAQAEHTAQGVKALDLPEVTLSANYLYLDDAVELSGSDILESVDGGEQVIATLAQNFGFTPGQLKQLNSAFSLTSTIAERENFTSSLRALWPVYTGGRITAAKDIAASKVEEARFDLQLQGLEQFEKLVRLYFGAVLAQQVLDTRQEVEHGLKTHRDHAVLLEQQGQIARVERMQAEAAYDKSVVERKKAERDLEIAQVALTRMLKAPSLVLPTDSLFVADSLPSPTDFLDRTLASYPGLEILEQKQAQARNAAAIEKGKYFPTVALFGNYSLYEEDDLASKLVPDWFVGVGVSMPIVERSGRAGKMQAAKSAEKRASHLQQQARSDLSVLIEKTYRQAEQALEEFRGLYSSRKLAEETVDLRVKAFNLGLSTSLDVVDAELFLAGVKTQRAVAVYNYVLALGRLFVTSSAPEDFFHYQNNNGIEDR